MKPKFEYGIVAVAFGGDGPTHEELEAKVQKRLQDGWEPLGPPFLGEEMMYQALTKNLFYPPAPKEMALPQMTGR